MSAALDEARPAGEGAARVPARAPGAPRAPWAERHWAPALAALLLVALVLRLAYLREVAALPFFDQPVGDSAMHLKRAAEIASGALLPARPFYYCSIFYPYFLAVVLGPFHGGLLAVCAIQVLAGVATAGILAWTARALHGAAAGLAAGALAALYGPSAFLEADVLGVAGGQLALALGLAACVAWLARADRPRAALVAMAGAGVAFGLAVVERANLLLVLPAVAAWCLAASGARRGLAAAAALAAGAALPLGIVLALNVAGTGQWVPLTTSGGINLSLGFHDGATGTYDEPWEREAPEFSARYTEPEEAMTAWASKRAGRALTGQQASDYWRREALAFIAAHPAEAARLVLRKAALLLNNDEVPNHLDFEFLRERAPALWLLPVTFAVVLVLAVFAVGDALRRRALGAGTGLMLAVSGAAFASVLPFTVADRYRAPLVPALIVVAGAGLVALARLPRDRAARRAPGTLLALAACLAAAVFSVLPQFRAERGRDWWMYAEAWAAKGDLPDAIGAYQAALRERGDTGELLNNLALVYRRMGDRADAIAALRRAIAAEPRLVYPHKNLGLLLVSEGRFDEALRELEMAARLGPDDAEVLGAIGSIRAERGERAAAAAAFARARRLAPGDPRLLGLIRHYQADSASGGSAGRAAR